MTPFGILTAATTTLAALAGTAVLASTSGGALGAVGRPHDTAEPPPSPTTMSLSSRRWSWSHDVQSSSTGPWSREQGVDLLPASARLVSLTFCRLSTHQAGGGQTWLVEETSHTTEDLTELEAGLRVPDQDDWPCRVETPSFIVQDTAGIRYRPRLPRAGCSVDYDAIKALGAAGERGKKTLRFVRPLESEAEIRMYCPRTVPYPREYFDETGPHQYPKPPCE